MSEAVQLSPWDWAFLFWFLLVTLGVGLYYRKRASANLDEYFLSGRKLPWWALGTSIVATTFAADTPIVVAGFVIQGGIAQNWLWWSFLFGGTLTVFVFAKWWRRAEVVTEIELIARRYDGRSAAVLRGVKAVFLGLVVNTLIFGFVTKAMSSVVGEVFGVAPWISLAILLALAFLYTMLSGLWGVVATDVLQFVMAMLGAVLLAVLSVAEVGGLDELVSRVNAIDTDKQLLSILPSGWGALSASVMILLLVNWWAVYYPGAEPGGGGYVVQRMSAAIDEDHARKGTLWYICAHYVLRPWPWILVGLSAVALEPRFLADAGEFTADRAYPWMFRVLPVGILGLVVASFFAAFMSTITTTLNLSASYLINDLYLPLRAGGGRSGERESVFVARIAVLVVAAAGSWVSYALASAGDGWSLIMNLTAGTGLVLILRWVWWRVNAWTEIAAMLASAVAFSALHLWTVAPREGEGDPVALGEWLAAWSGGPQSEVGMLFTILVSTAVWLPVTLLTRPVAEPKLDAFYRMVRPGGAWSSVAARCGLPTTRMDRELKMWAASTLMIFGALLGVGSLLLQEFTVGGAWFGGALVGGLWLSALFSRESRMEERLDGVAE